MGRGAIRGSPERGARGGGEGTPGWGPAAPGVPQGFGIGGLLCPLPVVSPSVVFLGTGGSNGCWGGTRLPAAPSRCGCPRMRIKTPPENITVFY